MRWLPVLACLWMSGCGGSNVQQAAHRYPDMSTPDFQVFASECALCHAPPQPQKHRAIEWPQVVERMIRHRSQRGLPPLPDVQRAAILRYLQTHARGDAA